MKLKVENFIEKRNFSESVEVLFTDAVICYKAGANRAALLFSYLGFMTILKERIISSNKPKEYVQRTWDDMRIKLLNEDCWEKSIFEATQKRGRKESPQKDAENPIFNINEGLRDQIKYWKDRRNDCAHFKENIIESFHVESFWAFMESNLSKITVEGGMYSLLNKISVHFNTSLTPPDKDCTFLVKEIEEAVERSKINDFWIELLSNWEYDLSKRAQVFISKSLENNSDYINKPLIELFKQEDYFLKSYLNYNPSMFVRLGFSEEEIRVFWKTKLKNYDNRLDIYAVMLNNDLIPSNQIIEANTVMISNLDNYNVDVKLHNILKINKFFDVFKSEIIDNKKFCEFLWVNNHASLISDVIEHYPADVHVITRMCEVYNEPTNSNWLLERLECVFIPSNSLTDDYKAIIKDNNIFVPSRLEVFFKN